METHPNSLTLDEIADRLERSAAEQRALRLEKDRRVVHDDLVEASASLNLCIAKIKELDVTDPPHSTVTALLPEAAHSVRVELDRLAVLLTKGEASRE